MTWTSAQVLAFFFFFGNDRCFEYYLMIIIIIIINYFDNLIRLVSVSVLFRIRVSNNVITA